MVPNYLGKIIRRETSRNTLPGASKGRQAAGSLCQQPKAIVVAKAVASPTRTKSHHTENGEWDRCGSDTQSPFDRNWSSQIEPASSCFFHQVATELERGKDILEQVKAFCDIWFHTLHELTRSWPSLYETEE